jgi:DNA-binding GntR family transcriptional regulator
MNKSNLSEQAYLLIKSKLADYEKGSFISARESARLYNMSYTPMREALQRLHREGFLKLIPNVGYFVNSIEVLDVIHIFQVRECMETFVMEKVLSNINDADILYLEEHNQKQQEYLKQKEIWSYMDCDEKFHLKPFLIYGNPILLKTYRNVREQYKICSANIIANNMSAEVYNEHDKIVDAFKSRDKNAVVSACREHIEKAKNRIIDGFVRVE